MPQASEELREAWNHYEEGGGDASAIGYLKALGYKLTPQWEWKKPTPDHVLTKREASAVRYLIDEWDFGGVIP